MGRTALNIRDKPYSTRIMFIFRPVKSLTTTLVSPLFVFTHDKLLNRGAFKQRFQRPRVKTLTPSFSKSGLFKIFDPQDLTLKTPQTLTSYFYIELCFYARYLYKVSTGAASKNQKGKEETGGTFLNFPI